MNRPLISIVIPVYNVELYIEACIMSVLNQTYKNIEIIIVDDGSPDNSIARAKKIVERDSRVIFLSKINGGLSDARNFGVCHSQGDYIYFIDGDDVILPHCIEMLYSYLIKHGSDIAIGNYQEINDEETIDMIKTREYKNGALVLTNKQAFNHIYSKNLHTCVTYTVAWNKLYKRDIIKQTPFPYGKIHEDEFTTYKLYMKSHKIVYIDLPTYLYRIRSNSIMTSDFNLTDLHTIEAYEERIKLLCDYDDELLLTTQYQYIYQLARYRKKLIQYNLKVQAKELREKQIAMLKQIFFKLSAIQKIKIIKHIYF